MKIHAIQTGSVRIKESQRAGRGREPARQLHVFMDSLWTDPLPIYAWAIETNDGVIVVDGPVSYFLAGDTSYTQELLADQKVDGVSPSKAVSLPTMQAILAFAQEYPTVYLPSHDPESERRLQKAATLQLNDGCPAIFGRNR
jgi:hypothetical protein